MEKEKLKYNVLRWISFIPLQVILYIAIVWIISTIPIYRLINWLFDVGNNPFKTHIVNGPIGFLLVAIPHTAAWVGSIIASIQITSRPVLAFRILIISYMIPIIILLFLVEVKGVDIIKDGNLAYRIAKDLGLAILAIGSFFFKEEDIRF